jgi:hypothetical protein
MSKYDAKIVRSATHLCDILKKMVSHTVNIKKKTGNIWSSTVKVLLTLLQIPNKQYSNVQQFILQILTSH